MAQASSPPFCGTQLAEICGVDRPRYEGDRGAPRLSAPYNSAQLGPPGLEGITPPRRRGAPGGKTSQEEAYFATLRTFIVKKLSIEMAPPHDGGQVKAIEMAPPWRIPVFNRLGVNCRKKEGGMQMRRT